MVRAWNDGEQFERCGLAGQSGPESFAIAFLNILSENVLLCRILAGVPKSSYLERARATINREKV